MKTNEFMNFQQKDPKTFVYITVYYLVAAEVFLPTSYFFPSSLFWSYGILCLYARRAF